MHAGVRYSSQASRADRTVSIRFFRSRTKRSIPSRIQFGERCASSSTSSDLPPVRQRLSQSGVSRTSAETSLNIQLIMAVRAAVETMVESSRSAAERVRCGTLRLQREELRARGDDDLDVEPSRIEFREHLDHVGHRAGSLDDERSAFRFTGLVVAHDVGPRAASK